MYRLACALSGLLALMIATTTHVSAAPQISISNAFAYPNIPGATMGAAFANIHNNGTTKCRLTRLSSAATQTVELHDMIEQGGIMRMVPRSALEIAPGEVLQLRPRHSHLMLIGLKQDLIPDQHFTVLLDFGACGTLDQDFVIKPRTQE